MSIRCRSVELGITSESIRRSMRLDLGLHPYKIVLIQQLKTNDHRMLREFVLQILNENTGFGQTIIFADAAQFI